MVFTDRLFISLPEVFPTCKQLYEFMDSEKALDGEATVVNGFFTTDPDGAGGVPPFTVECTFPETVFEVDTGKHLVSIVTYSHLLVY